MCLCVYSIRIIVLIRHAIAPDSRVVPFIYYYYLLLIFLKKYILHVFCWFAVDQTVNRLAKFAQLAAILAYIFFGVHFCHVIEYMLRRMCKCHQIQLMQVYTYIYYIAVVETSFVTRLSREQHHFSARINMEDQAQLNAENHGMPSENIDDPGKLYNN